MNDGNNKEKDLSGENLKSGAFCKFKSIFIIGVDAYKAIGVNIIFVEEISVIPALSNCSLIFSRSKSLYLKTWRNEKNGINKAKPIETNEIFLKLNFLTKK